MLGDSVTTDHISPAGSIARTSPAGAWLVEHGVEPREFNSYGARRGHHEVMMRGTFANIRLRNLLTPDAEGNVTEHLPSGERMSIFDAAQRYVAEGTPLVAPGRQGVRLGLVARLGRQGALSARRARGDRGVVRADPSVEPGRDGHPAAAVPAGRERQHARPDRPRALQRRRHRRWPSAAAGAERDRDAPRRVASFDSGRLPGSTARST